MLDALLGILVLFGVVVTVTAMRISYEIATGSRARRRLARADRKFCPAPMPSGTDYKEQERAIKTITALLPTPQQRTKWLQERTILIEGRTRIWSLSPAEVACQRKATGHIDRLCVHAVQRGWATEILSLLLWIKVDDRHVWNRGNAY